MKESFWGILIITIGVTAIAFIFFFQTLTNTSEQNYTLVREVTEAAMYDAVDLNAYRQSGVIKINREKFVENFVRRFAESASLSNTYEISIYDVNETPPKVSLEVRTKVKSNVSKEQGKEVVEVQLSNKLDAILETPY